MDEGVSDSGSDDGSEDSDEGDDLGGFIVPDTDIDSNSDGEKIKSRPKTAKRKSKSKSKSKSKAKVKARAQESPKSLAQLRAEGLRNKSARRKYLKRLKKNFQPSAKTTRTLQLLGEIRDRGEGEKTIVFSNFTSFLDMIETALYDNADFRNYIRYDGSMKATERNGEWNYISIWHRFKLSAIVGFS
jgi:SNF2 family DNA or RNA helicase